MMNKFNLNVHGYVHHIRVISTFQRKTQDEQAQIWNLNMFSVSSIWTSIYLVKSQDWASDNGAQLQFHPVVVASDDVGGNGVAQDSPWPSAQNSPRTFHQLCLRSPDVS